MLILFRTTAASSLLARRGIGTVDGGTTWAKNTVGHLADMKSEPQSHETAQTLGKGDGGRFLQGKVRPSAHTPRGGAYGGRLRGAAHFPFAAFFFAQRTSTR